MRHIVNESKERDVYMVSVNDDRRLLLNIMDKLKWSQFIS